MTGALARPVDPRGALRGAAGTSRRARRCAGFDALLVGVGPDLRYLTGYEAMPLERLTMLVVCPARERASSSRGSSAGGRGAGLRTSLADHRRGTRPRIPYRDRRPAAARRRRPPPRCWLSDRLSAAHLLRAPGGACRHGRIGLAASELLRELRMVKDDDEIALLRWRPTRRSGRRADRRRPPGRPHGGRRRRRGPRAARRRGPRRGPFRDRRLRPELARRRTTMRRTR